VKTAPVRIPVEFFLACRRNGVWPTRLVLVAFVQRQQLGVFERERFGGGEMGGSGRRTAINGPGCPAAQPHGGSTYRLLRSCRASTSRSGTGQRSGSYQTPLGLHRIAVKIGAGHPVGTVFESRRAVGFTWQGRGDAAIAHRILWLQGLEPGFNQGAEVDSYTRYIYIHGLGNEPSLGRPASRGCIHLASGDLMPLFDRVPVGTLVWIC
jgi:L,D-transpeptidase YbiS